jgi:hypothetical protein
MPKQAEMGVGDVAPTHSQPRRKKRVDGQHQAKVILPPGRTQYSLYRELGGPRDRSGRLGKYYSPTGIRFPDRSACTSPYPNYAIPAAIYNITC